MSTTLLTTSMLLLLQIHWEEIGCRQEFITTLFAFRLGENTQLLNPVQKQGCLAPGKLLAVPMVYMESLDFAIQITPQDPSKPLVYGLLARTGGQEAVLEKGVVAEPVVRVLSAPVSAEYVLVLGAPEQAQGETCLQFTVGQIDWDKMINPK